MKEPVTFTHTFSWPNDEAHFEAFANSVRIAAEELLIEMFGERCPDFSEHCECCKRWVAYDALVANPWKEDPAS